MSSNRHLRNPALLAFGEAVRTHRRAAGMTQEGLAEKAGLDRTYVGHVEQARTNPTLATITALAAALGVTSAILLARAEPAQAAA